LYRNEDPDVVPSNYFYTMRLPVDMTFYEQILELFICGLSRRIFVM